jgi:hypothetical protein
LRVNLTRGVALLDKAAELGFDVTVRDETQWEERSSITRKFEELESGRPPSARSCARQWSGASGSGERAAAPGDHVS